MANPPSPGQLTSLSLILKNYDGSKQQDITQIMQSLSITEDIFKPTLYGSIEILDAIGLLEGEPDNPSNDQRFMILGEEFIELAYVINEVTTSLRFAIYKITDLVYHNNNTSKSYVLHFASEEHLLDAAAIVQKSYNGTNSDNITSLCNEFLKINTTLPNGKRIKKLNRNQPTKGLQRGIIPSLSPLNACQFFARRSIADQTFESASYLFFENMDGYNFCDVEYLIKTGMEKRATAASNNSSNTADPFQYYFEKPTIKVDASREAKTFIRMQHKSYFDTIEKLKKGMFESEVVIYDFINHRTVNNRFKFLDNDDKTNNKALTLGNLQGKSYPENSIDFMQDYTSKDDNENKFFRKFYMVKDMAVTAQDTFMEQILPARASYFTRLAQNCFTVDGYGDPNIKAGDVIAVNIPNSSAHPTDKNKNAYIADFYIVGTINHNFTQNTYLTKMDIFKNAFDAQVNTTVADSTTTTTATDNLAKASDYNTPDSPLLHEALGTALSANPSALSTFFRNILGI